MLKSPHIIISSTSMTLLVTLFAPVLMLFHLVGPVPSDLGVHDGALSSCTTPAHCARQTWPSHSPDTDFSALVAYVTDMPRTEVVEQNDRYVHAEASSALFGFVDDFELLLDVKNSSIQARSVSRLGDSDLGVNANRLGELKELVSN